MRLLIRANLLVKMSIAMMVHSAATTAFAACAAPPSGHVAVSAQWNRCIMLFH